MELLLLMLLGGLSVGAGLWATMGGKKGEEKAPFSDLYRQPPAGLGEGAPGAEPTEGGPTGGGPRSSPGLPGGAGGGVGGGAGATPPGQPVVIGDPLADQARGGPAGAGAGGLEDLLKQSPAQVKAQVEDGAERKRVEAEKRRRAARKTPLQVGYNCDQLIPRSSPYAHHRRMLATADLLVEKQKDQEALEVYERVHKRVPDDEIRHRLESNIEDIKRWQEGLELEEESLTFPNIIIPLTTEALAQEHLNEGLRQIAEGLVEQIKDAFQRSEPTQPDPSVQAQAPAQTPESGAVPELKLAPSYPVPAIGEMIPVDRIDPRMFERSWLAGTIDLPDLPPPGIDLNDSGDVLTNGWSDADFEREWEKYKNLPPEDRRTGIDRRLVRQQEMGEVKGDRRTGEDRRKHDLFEEREDFLKKLEEHKRRKEEYEQHKSQEKPKRRGHLYYVPPDGVPPDGVEDEVGSDSELPPAAHPAIPPFIAEDEEPLMLPSGGIRIGRTDGSEPDERGEPTAQSDEPPQSEPRVDSPAAPQGDPPSFSFSLAPPPEEEEELLTISGRMRRESPITLPDPSEAEALPEEEPESPPPPEPLPIVTPEGSELATSSRIEEPDLPEPLNLVAPEDLESLDLPDAVESEIYGPDTSEDEEEEQAQAEAPAAMSESDDELDMPEVDFPDSDLGEELPEPPPVQEIRGVLELKPPEEDDAPFLALTYDFTKIPDSFKLSKDYHTMEFAYYKYKPMLIKAQEFTRRKMLKNALSYYRVIKSQNIPPEFKRMINRNIRDITEYLEKFLMTRGG